MKFGNWNLKPRENYISLTYEPSEALYTSFHAELVRIK